MNETQRLYKIGRATHVRRWIGPKASLDVIAEKEKANADMLDMRAGTLEIRYATNTKILFWKRNES